MLHCIPLSFRVSCCVHKLQVTFTWTHQTCIACPEESFSTG